MDPCPGTAEHIKSYDDVKSLTSINFMSKMRQFLVQLETPLLVILALSGSAGFLRSRNVLKEIFKVPTNTNVCAFIIILNPLYTLSTLADRQLVSFIKLVREILTKIE